MRQTRWWSWLALALFGGAPPAAWAQTEVHAILDRAIAAHGGERVLSARPAGYLKCRGTVFLAQNLTFASEVYYRLPGRLKQVEEFELTGQKVAVTTGLRDGQAWRTVNGQSRDLDKKSLTEIREAAHLLAVNRLVPLKAKPYHVAVLGTATVDDRPADEILVSAEGHRDVHLYFDRQTHLLVKLSQRVTDLKTGAETLEERFYRAYRPVDGLQQPQKVAVWRDGKKYLEAEVVEAKLLERLDDAAFADPRGP